jgi:hypothetical protein
MNYIVKNCKTIKIQGKIKMCQGSHGNVREFENCLSVAILRQTPESRPLLFKVFIVYVILLSATAIKIIR